LRQLQGSGAISMADMNLVLDRASTTQISMIDSSLRTDFGVGGSGTQISFSQGYGRPL
jgi:hypothetical protein